MIPLALGVGGWGVALLTSALAGVAQRLRGAQAEAAVRAAHELRGPLTATRLGLALEARTGSVSPARLRALELELDRAALALEDLAGDSRATRRARAVGGWPGRVDMARLLEDCVAAASARAVEAGVELDGAWCGEPAQVWGDGLRIAQVLGNLIANAIEHGGGAVEIRGRARGDSVRIDVCDCGPGLPAPVAELARRARRGRGRRGRGLAIATAIAEQHGGRLGAAPNERGARLVLDLPVAASDSGITDPNRP